MSTLARSSTLPAAIQTLAHAASDLLFMSETDAPFEAFFWPGIRAEELTAQRVAELTDAPSDASVEVISVEDFFRNATTGEEWHNEEEAARVTRFQQLVKAIEDTLADPKVFRIGERRIDCYIVGGVDGGCGGLKTFVVET